MRADWAHSGHCARKLAKRKREERFPSKKRNEDDLRNIGNTISKKRLTLWKNKRHRSLYVRRLLNFRPTVRLGTMFISFA